MGQPRDGAAQHYHEVLLTDGSPRSPVGAQRRVRAAMPDRPGLSR